jgi:hypothetical protein
LAHGCLPTTPAPSSSSNAMTLTRKEIHEQGTAGPQGTRPGAAWSPTDRIMATTHHGRGTGP